MTLFRNKRFMLDEMTLQNASKFAIFYIYENPKLLFPIFISCYHLTNMFNMREWENQKRESADFELLTTNTHNTQGAFQIFSFFTVFHYITLSKSHWEWINGKPDIFFCYHCTILTVRTIFTILDKDFLKFYFCCFCQMFSQSPVPELPGVFSGIWSPI